PTTGNYTMVATSPVGCTSTSSSILVSNPSDKNFIVRNQINIENKKTESDLYLLPLDNAIQTVNYFDGLGRPVLVISTRASPLKKDLVQTIDYDEFGRDPIKYLPYASSTYGKGYFKPDAIGSGTKANGLYPN